MSQLPSQAVDEFQALWKKHYGVDLPREEAVLRAHQTLAVLRLLCESVLNEALPERDPTESSGPDG